MMHEEQCRPISFGLIGTYDVENFGDCIFPDIYRQQLRRRFPGATFSYYSPRSTAAAIVTERNIQALPGCWGEANFNEDVLILTGGETLSLGHTSGTYIFPVNTPSAFLRLWLMPILAIQSTKTRFAVHCCGLAPGHDESALLIGKALLHADRVTVRDAVTAKRLGGNFETAVDPAFLMHELETADGWARRCAAVVPNTLRDRGYLAAQVSQSYLSGNLDEWCVAVANLAVEHGKGLVLLPICNFLGDFSLLARASLIIRDLKLLPPDQVFVLDRGLEVLDTAAVIAGCDGFIGTSLHGAVAAVSFAKPKAILTKSIDGKHAQTLIAAGADGAACTAINDIPATFRANLAINHAAERAEACRRAARDFSLLCNAICSASADKNPVSTALVAEIAGRDQAPAKILTVRIKRALFGLMRRKPNLWEAYERHKFARRFPK